MSDKSSRTSLSSDSTFSLKMGLVDVTSGGGLATGDLASRITSQARTLLPHIPDRSVATATAELLGTIEAAVYALQANGSDVQAFPPVRAAIESDGSVSLEWTTQDFRLGFSVEADPKVSTWYLVTSKRLGETGMNGFLYGVNQQDLISLVVGFVRTNT